MKRILLVLVFSTSAFAQAPVIQSIVPNSGPETGGTEVVITGTNLNVPVTCLLPCPPRVVFGDISVDAIEESNTRLRVTTPAHAVGTVDVTVAVTGREPVVVEDGFTFVAGPENAYERVLLPIFFKGTVPGAYGTQWKTDFWMHYGGSSAVQIAPATCPTNTPCPPVFPNTISLGPGESLHNPTVFFTEYETNFSQILYVSKDGAKDVSMSLRVSDVSRSTENHGTDIPVIREGELLTGTAQLFDVPLTDQNFRLLLRVYDVTYPEAEFSVLLYPSSEEAEPVTYGMTLHAHTLRGGSFRDEAAYAEFDLSSLLMLRRLWPDSVRIEIKPMTPGSRYWAFISVTNNETQLVTLITPQ